MYSMLKKKDYPGYLYMLENGATTTWEHWNGDRSRIHNCYNGIGSWFYQALGGIRPDENTPAYRKVLIAPQVPEGLTWARTFKETPYGRLVVNWELKDKLMSMNLEIPVGMQAEVALPAGVIRYTLDGRETGIPVEKAGTVALKSGKSLFSYLNKD
jgi:alpha-L-rhamnosidase